jgi:N-(2-amino-2-carboxyethyl)-L-glutamate synthase
MVFTSRGEEISREGAVGRKRTACEGVLASIGETPLIRLRRLVSGSEVSLFVKLEAANPGGSIKDRAALAIVEDGLRTGIIRPDTVIIESSSGNMGIGLAQICRYYGLQFICVVDVNTAKQNISLLRAYGATVEYVGEPDPETGELLQARLKRVQALCLEIKNSFWPNQYSNPNNPRAHYETTIREIAESLEHRIDFLFVPTSTCGTLRGCAEYIRNHGLETRIVAVDAVGSLIFSDQKARRRIPGLGAGLRPPLCDISLIDECIHVSDVDCIIGCRTLLRREAILAGGSSGGVIAAFLRTMDGIPPGAICVGILPDRGERYLDTIYSDDWVVENFPEAYPALQAENGNFNVRQWHEKGEG